MTFRLGNKTFSVTRDLINVTSNHRPDTRWKFIDKSGHIHVWFDGDKKAENYHPLNKYHVPSIEWIIDGMDMYPDGSEYEFGHYECIMCRDRVNPGYTADTCEQYIPGLVHYWIDDVEVSKEEFESQGIVL